jgi:hypothetical protein
MRWPHWHDAYENENIKRVDYFKPVAHTSAEISTYNHEKWINSHRPHQSALTKSIFEEQLRHNTALFTHETDHARDEQNLITIFNTSLAASHNHEKDHSKLHGKTKVINAHADASRYFKAIVTTLDKQQQMFLFHELKADFLEYLLMPFYILACCNFTHYELKNTSTVQTFIILLLLICFLFYALCLVWIWNVDSAFSDKTHEDLSAYLVANCQMPSIGTIQTYFKFRLVVYFLSPLTLIAIAISSHMHQRVMLQRLTGIPYDPKTQEHFESTSWWHNKVPIATTATVMLVNVIFGAATIALDILFLQGIKAWDRQATDIDKICLMAISGTPPNQALGGNLTLSSSLPSTAIDTKPAVKDVPIPLVTFSFIYTLWGLLYVIAVARHPDMVSDEDTRVVADYVSDVVQRDHAIHKALGEPKKGIMGNLLGASHGPNVLITSDAEWKQHPGHPMHIVRA